MRSATWDQRTIVQTHDPANGDRYVQVLAMEGVSLPVGSPSSLTIDGESWYVVRARVDVDTQTRTTVTTVTVIKD